MSQTLLKTTLTAQLSQFTGATSGFHAHRLQGWQYSDGVRYLIDHYNAALFVDSVFFSQGKGRVSTEFQRWTLDVRRGQIDLHCHDLDGCKLYTQSFTRKKIPVPAGVTLWLCADTLMLPDEF